MTPEEEKRLKEADPILYYYEKGKETEKQEQTAKEAQKQAKIAKECDDIVSRIM